MHLSNADLRFVRQDGLSIGFGILGPIAYVVAETPASGSSGTALERPCERSHWGIVLAGQVQLRYGRRRLTIPPRHAFHVPPGGAPHRFVAGPGARIAAFETVDAAVDTSDDGLRALGLEPTDPIAGVEAAASELAAEPRSGEVEATFTVMSSLVMTRARMGSTSGYTSAFCDVPHWGVVAAGGAVLEWEDDVEILGTGDVYYCPAGPPGHRLLAADPVTIVDFTPLSSLTAGARLSPWRRPMGRLAADHPRATAAVPSLAALA